MNETTKRFPRSLNEAFRSTPEYAGSLQGPYRRFSFWSLILRLIGAR
jgi:hypothetical protein